MSPEENEQLAQFVKLSGYTKQDYIISRLLQRDIVVKGNPRTYKALRDQLADVLAELKRLESVSDEQDELFSIMVKCKSKCNTFDIFAIINHKNGRFRVPKR